VSEDLDERLALADRIAVIFDVRIVRGPRPPPPTSPRSGRAWPGISRWRGRAAARAARALYSPPLMPLDIGLTALALPFAEFPALAREAEVRGYHTAWVGEAAGIEAIAVSTLIATHTERLRIANGVIPVQTRSPIVYGQAAATLAHLAPGRFSLGLGLSSEIIVGQWHGLPFVPSTQQMREAVQIIRMAASGERVNFEGRFYRLKNFRLGIPAPATPPKIVLAALGPRMCELAGEIADGVLLNWIPPEAMAESIRHVEAGAKRAGRRLEDVDVAVYVRTCVTDEPGPVREALARDITGYAIVDSYARFFASAGFAPEVEAVNAAWRAGDRAGATRQLSPRVLDGLGAVGPAAFCRERLDAFARTGARPVVLPFAVPGPDARASHLRTFRSFL
jgi:probable F420-dependent oxidoreductase